ncbi:MAG TPA: alpha-(1-_3)-arabinofuranosyltransferase family protein, partial [Acidimicrobiales bacterium]|nr:alpha-(1->3)-arabinofuranosyltransferase family protein [Acidimicrobiales bacterium]
GFGTVTHQNIGYLWPMGPWYWAFHAAGVATWVAQRLWTGSLLFLAGLGVVFLMRTLGWERRPALLAALAYELSPYVMLYEARTSAILLPWAGLPWMLALTVRAVRHGGWRYPALFALVVPLVGSVNATSLLYAGLAPVMWLPFAVWVTRETTLRRAVSVALRIGALSLATSLWWIAGLATQGAYGIDVLRYTETVRAVARASVPYEVLRGLGNWYFYGRDRVSPWVQPATAYTQHIWLIAVSFAVPVLALGGAAVARWRYRAYFATLVVLGAVIAVGVHPYNHPSPLGAVLKSVANSSSAGLAMRTSVRAVPLVVLGTAVLLAAGAEALIARAPALRLAAVVAVVALVASDIPALWTGGFVEPNLDHPQRVPGYWLGAARQLDDAGPSTRVLELPGADFSYYRWGVTVDPVTPGLLHRPLGGRELTPFGSPPSADFMQALDRRLQEGVLEPQAIAPVARLMGVGTVLLRNDLQYERFRTPRPRLVWRLLDPPPPGLGAPAPFGPAMTAAPLVSLVDELTLGTPRDAPAPPSLAAFPVQAPVPIARAERAERPLLVAGDAEGVVEAGAAGLLDGTGPVIFAASGAADPALVTGALDLGADIVLTDTNRRRGRRWGTVRENYGYTERAGERPLVQDPSDARLPVFPRSTDEDRTVTEQRGLASVMATDYGDPVAYAPGSRPALAVDGDPSTAWTVGAFDDPRAQHLDVALAHPVTTDRVTLVQPLSPPNERYVTRATLRFDHGPSVPVTLGPSSRVATGQTVTFPGRTFQRLSVVIDATNYGPRADFSGVSGVGFAEVRIGAERVDEVVRLPTRPLSSLAGAASLDHRLVVLLSRSRANPGEPYKRDEETAMSRSFTLPAGRSFSLAGTARLSDTAPDPVLDAATGQPGLAQGAAVATASTRIGGDLRAGAQAAFDGDPTTAWSPTIEDAAGQPWVEVSAPAPVMFDHLDLAVVADGRHSVPARLGLEVDGRAVRTLEVPQVADGPDQGATVAVPLRFPPVTGRVVRVVVEAVRPVRTINYFSRTAQVLPPGLAEVGVPGVRVPPPPPFPARCRRDLLEVDGRPLPLLVSAPTGGDPRDPSRVPLSLRTCDGAPLALGPGSHLLQAIPGRVSGFDLDRLTLASDRRGGPVAVDAGGTPAPGGAGRTDGAPRVRVVGKTRTSARVHVDLVGSAVAGDAPFWLVLGQSHNDGWRAEVTAVQGPAGRTPGPAPALGRPKLIDGFANGWLVRAPQGATALDLRMTWTPQRRVWAALAGSGLAVMVCLVLVARRRRGVPAPGAVPGPGAAPAWAPGLPGAPRPPARRRVAAVAAAVA